MKTWHLVKALGFPAKRTMGYWLQSVRHLLWQQQGKTGAARQLLAEIYGWFTEGFDTADIQEARALLQDLT